MMNSPTITWLLEDSTWMGWDKPLGPTDCEHRFEIREVEPGVYAGFVDREWIRDGFGKAWECVTHDHPSAEAVRAELDQL